MMMKKTPMPRSLVQIIFSSKSTDSSHRHRDDIINRKRLPPWRIIKSYHHRSRKQLKLLFAIIVLVILSIVALSYFCPQNLCPQASPQAQRELSSSSSSSNVAKLFESNNSSSSSSSSASVYHHHHANQQQPQLSSSSSSLLSSDTGIISAAESERVAQIMRHYFSFDFDRYESARRAQMSQISFDDMQASPAAGVNAFHIEKRDVIVFLHMQKTGGSAFDRHLIRDLVLDEPCRCEPKKRKKKRCRCYRPTASPIQIDRRNSTITTEQQQKQPQLWLFSRHSIGWKCGLHADYTELIHCVDQVLNEHERIDDSNRFGSIFGSKTIGSLSRPVSYSELLYRRQMQLSPKKKNNINGENTDNMGIKIANKPKMNKWSMIKDRSWQRSRSIDRTNNNINNNNNNRRYFYVTILREPIARFISEFKHVQRGATWKNSRHWCDGRLPTAHELPRCFAGANWRNVTLREFMDCESNLAYNRQTRMLADLSLVGCYNRSAMPAEDRDAIMLYSAKRNLRAMSYFGLCEEQLASQYLYERTFAQRFRRSFVQYNSTRSSGTLSALTAAQYREILRRNHLDVRLYAYAKSLFRRRFAAIRNADPQFERRYREMLADSSQIQRQQSSQSPLAANFTETQPKRSISNETNVLINDHYNLAKFIAAKHAVKIIQNADNNNNNNMLYVDDDDDVIEQRPGSIGSSSIQDSLEDYYTNNNNNYNNKNNNRIDDDEEEDDNDENENDHVINEEDGDDNNGAANQQHHNRHPYQQQQQQPYLKLKKKI